MTEFKLRDGLNYVLNELILNSSETKSVSVVSKTTTTRPPVAKKPKTSLILTEKIQRRMTPEVSTLLHHAKGVYNFGNFVMRKLFFLNNNNPNVSWDDFFTIRESIMPHPSIKDYVKKRERILCAFDNLKQGIKFKNGKQMKHSIVTLLARNKFYTSLYAQVSQQILREGISNWLKYFSLKKLFDNKELKHKPHIPGFLPPDGLFMLIITGQLMKQRNNFESHMARTKRTINYKKHSKTTSEMLFPKELEKNFRHVRVRYHVIRNLKEVRVIPHGEYYNIEIRYRKKIRDQKLCRQNVIAIDLNQKIPLAIANNMGLQPLLIPGREFKRANYIINKYSPKYRRCQGLYRDILDKSKKMNLPILQTIRKKKQSYSTIYQQKRKITRAVLNLPTMTITQFRNRFGETKKFDNLFQFVKKLPDKKKRDQYLNYLEAELQKKTAICNNLDNLLRKKPEQTHVQRIIELQQKNQTKLNRLFRNYRNRTSDATHKITRYVINYCRHYNIGTIVIGYNEGWKIRSKLNKAVNRMFIPLPFYKIITAFKYKANQCGIRVILSKEGYTSSCSAPDYEPIRRHEHYAGFRNGIITGKDGIHHKHYGQFYSRRSKKFIHADINGAFNIGRKSAPELFNGLPQCWMCIPPKRITVT